MSTQKKARGQGGAETVFKEIPKPPENMAQEQRQEKPAQAGPQGCGNCEPSGSSREKALEAEERQWNPALLKF